MKTKRKHVELDEQKKHLVIYSSLLAAAIFITIGNPEGLWLPIGLAVGIIFDQFFFFKKKRENAKNKLDVNTSEKDNDETIENSNK